MSTLSRVLILSMLLAVALSWPYPADPAPETVNQEGPAAPLVEGDEESVDGRWGGHRHHHHHGHWGHGNRHHGYNNHYGGYNRYNGGYLGWREGQKAGDGAAPAPVDAAAPPVPAVPADNIKFD